MTHALLLSLVLAVDGGKPGTWAPPKLAAPDPHPIRSSLTTHLELSGPLGADYAEKLVDGRVPQLRACFEKSLPPGAKTYGRYVLTMGFAASGKPTSAVITTDTLRLPKTAACVKKVVLGFRFPKATQEGKLELTLNFASLE